MTASTNTLLLGLLALAGGASAAPSDLLRAASKSALPVEGMRDARELSGDYAWDDDFFTFNDDTLWSDYAINPKRCIEL
jgi:hypothetical protein